MSKKKIDVKLFFCRQRTAIMTDKSLSCHTRRKNKNRYSGLIVQLKGRENKKSRAK